MLWYMTSKVSKAAGIKTFFYYGTDIHYQRVRSSVYQTLFPDKGQFAFHNTNLWTSVKKSLQILWRVRFWQNQLKNEMKWNDMTSNENKII